MEVVSGGCGSEQVSIEPQRRHHRGPGGVRNAEERGAARGERPKERRESRGERRVALDCPVVVVNEFKVDDGQKSRASHGGRTEEADENASFHARVRHDRWTIPRERTTRVESRPCRCP